MSESDRRTISISSAFFDAAAFGTTVPLYSNHKYLKNFVIEPDPDGALIIRTVM